MSSNSNKIIEIMINGKINPIFFNANRFLISRYKDQLTDLSDHKKKEFIINCWKEEFHANLVINCEKNLNIIEFFSEKDTLMFLMKWRS
jgi:hypothetical protein